MKQHFRDAWGGYALLFYILVAIVTFGHGAHRSYNSDATNYENCLSFEQHMKIDGHCGLVAPSGAYSGFLGLLDGVGWPLYWSWVAFDVKEAKAK